VGADRELAHELREGVEVKVDGEHAAHLAVVVEDRVGASDAGHALVVEDIGRDPDDAADGAGAGVEGPLARVVARVVVDAR
jgi:hypothetical protein